MRIDINSLFILIGSIDFILWSMGKVPYGALCWAIPLIFGTVGTIINHFCN